MVLLSTYYVLGTGHTTIRVPEKREREKKEKEKKRRRMGGRGAGGAEEGGGGEGKRKYGKTEGMEEELLVIIRESDLN